MSTRYYCHNSLELSNGNAKVGPDTLIFNMTSATDCPSAKLGLCQLQDCAKCYALKAERLYTGCLPYRRRQAAYWADTHWNVIAKDFIGVLKRFPSLSRVKYIRFSECGDFRNQNDVYKLNTLAYTVNMHIRKPLIWYGYTARRDLDFSSSRHLLVKGSGHDNGNNGKVIVRKLTPAQKKRKTLTLDGVKHLVCPGKCYGCKICKTRITTPLVIALH